LSSTRFSVEGSTGAIETYLSIPQEKTASTQPLLLLCHGLPLTRNGGRTASLQLPQLGERLAVESGWAVGVASLRGVGHSGGSFSASGWREDLGTVLNVLGEGRSAIALTGFGFGGALALRVGVDDERIKGVTSVATPTRLAAWCGAPEQFLTLCRRAGVIDAATNVDPSELVDDVLSLDPLGAAAQLPPKRLMFVHGSNDQVVPPQAARDLLDAAEGHAELRIVQGAGHWMRADPRMFATMLGWLDRYR
jgi:uncharacterized protein